MSTIISFIRRHYLVFFVLILISLIYGTKHFVLENIARSEGRTYFPSPVRGNFLEGYYAQRAASAFSGDFIVGDINLYEYQDSPAFLPILNPLIMTGLSKIFGSLKAGIIASDFIFPSIIF